MSAVLDPSRDYAHSILDALERISAEITVPSNHMIRFNREHEMSWLMSVPSGSASLYVQRSKTNPNDAEQFNGEIRIHNNRPGVHTKYAAMLFLSQGSPFVGQQHSLLWNQEPFVYAETLGELEEKILTRFQAAMNRADSVDAGPSAPRP